MPILTKINLTPTRVEQFRYRSGGAKQQFLWDSQIPGLGLEAVASGRRSWVLSYRIVGKKKRITLGGFPELDLDEARDEAKDLLKGLRGGIDPVATRKTPQKAHTVQSLHDRYISGRYFRSRSPDFHANFKSTMRRYVLPEIGDQLLSSVQRSQIRSIIDDLVEVGKEGMAQGTLTHLRILFAYAVDEEFIEYTPTERVKVKRTTSGRRDQWFENPDDLKAIWNMDAPIQVRSVIRWCLLTGCRRDEARKSSWDSISDDRWIVEKTKNRRALVLPITDPMQVVLDEIRATFPSSPWIFPATTSWKKAIPRASLDYVIREASKGKWSLHVLRHTVETWLADLGVIEEHRNLVLNHWTGRMTERYRHGYQIETKRHVLELWHDKLMEMVG
ncbi:MAG: integrase family protein [Candidatus Thiodiazotropha sp.]|nr:integrase family protein [Candidatus Thiodiazotropha sp.]MCM8885217.1 integrase family protein [Candidatus Thiodiazotropha sp.]MCM8921005.1 integrase family protein [Candidatus Thiodiazotropha sp.]